MQLLRNNKKIAGPLHWGGVAPTSKGGVPGAPKHQTEGQPRHSIKPSVGTRLREWLLRSGN